ncbi:MAG: hypothetical protein HC925_05580, partial [Coleofasciculaceae cyanobacterium SM2_3_26]|nr:hypothetical protein [Coleofasciculaceae cyanobacterium SM2_3_26]
QCCGGSPGWGIVHHDSHLVLENNVVFDVAGAAIVAESGNELGAWRNNLTIKTTGMEFPGISEDFLNRAEELSTWVFRAMVTGCKEPPRWK